MAAIDGVDRAESMRARQPQPGRSFRWKRGAKHGSIQNSVRYVSTRIMVPLVDELNELEIDPKPLLHSAGTSISDVLNVPLRLPLSVASATWEAAVDITGDRSLGLRVGMHTDPRVLELFGYLLSTCMNVRAALSLTVGYFWLLDESHAMETCERGKDIKLCSTPEPGLSRPVVFTEYILAMYVTLLRTITGTDIRPEYVALEHQQWAGSQDYDDAFRCKVLFGQPRTELLFSEDVLAIPCLAFDPVLNSILERNAGEYLDIIPKVESLSDRVRVLVKSKLPFTMLTEVEAARMLCVSPRTLRRHLSEEQTSFRELCDDLRCELALRDLCELGKSIDDITEDLSFSSRGAFHQAFRRWTGMTPREYKRRSSMAE